MLSSQISRLGTLDTGQSDRHIHFSCQLSLKDDSHSVISSDNDVGGNAPLAARFSIVALILF